MGGEWRGVEGEEGKKRKKKIDKRVHRAVVQVCTLGLRELDFYAACEERFGQEGMSRSECFRKVAALFLQEWEDERGFDLEAIVRREELRFRTSKIGEKK